MINARIEILSKEVLSKCKSKGIEVYTLKKSKANTIAFTSNYRRRREFEITFLKDSKYRISTRFLGYKKAMLEIEHSVFDIVFSKIMIQMAEEKNLMWICMMKGR